MPHHERHPVAVLLAQILDHRMQGQACLAFEVEELHEHRLIALGQTQPVLAHQQLSIACGRGRFRADSSPPPVKIRNPTRTRVATPIMAMDSFMLRLDECSSLRCWPRTQPRWVQAEWGGAWNVRRGRR